MCYTIILIQKTFWVLLYLAEFIFFSVDQLSANFHETKSYYEHPLLKKE